MRRPQLGKQVTAMPDVSPSSAPGRSAAPSAAPASGRQLGARVRRNAPTRSSSHLPDRLNLKSLLDCETQVDDSKGHGSS
jgi:hypothetical protein